MMSLKITVVWGVTPRNLVGRLQRYQQTLSSECKSKLCEKRRYVNFPFDETACMRSVVSQ